MVYYHHVPLVFLFQARSKIQSIPSFYKQADTTTNLEEIYPLIRRSLQAVLQYIHMKIAKYGVNFLVLAESVTEYILHMECYLWQCFQPTPAGESQGTSRDEIALPVRIAEQILPYSY